MGQKDNTQVTPLNEEQLVEKQIELDTREKTLEESENYKTLFLLNISYETCLSSLFVFPPCILNE